MKNFQLWWHDPSAISAVEKALKSGQAVAGTSDTVLGLLADATQEGFLALNQIKGRNPTSLIRASRLGKLRRAQGDKPYVILIASPDKLTHFVQTPLSLQVQKLITSCWPGPLTLILKAKSDVGQFLAPLGSIALRVPNHAGLLALLPHFEGLYSTSANLSGQSVPATLDGLDMSIREKVAYVIGDQETNSSVVPSTIIDCTAEQLQVIREGAYSIQDIEKIIGHKISS